MAQVLHHPPSCNPTPNPPPWKSSNSRPKRKRPEDDDGGGGGGKRHRNPNPPLTPATATATAPPPPTCSNQVLSSSSCSYEDPYVMALRQFGMHLPRGYYFKPTMNQLVGHYLLRKINGTLSPIDIALIPECDVYGDEEPWDIWSRFGAADDRSIFLISPLKKKSANGTVNARRVGSEGGTWHEESKKHHPVDGMILKAVERQFSYRKLNSPKNPKFPWLLKEFTLDNYPGGNYAVCELRKKGCDSAVCPPDSHYAPLPCHILSSSSSTTTEMMMTPHDDSSPPPCSLLPSSTTETELVEDSEYAAELDHILANIDFSGCEGEEITSSPSQSQVGIDDVESHFLLPGKDDGFINIEHYNVESLGDEAELLVYDAALTSSVDLGAAPTKPDDMEYAPWMMMRIRSCREQPPIHTVPFNSIVPDSLC